jgi:predicted amidohydrolase
MVILEARNLDLSAWTALWTSLYTGRQVNGQIAELILCPAQTDAVRTQIRRYMAAHATQNQAVVV